MAIAWNMFTPWSALAGGALIGIAAGMFVLLNGRIAGFCPGPGLVALGMGIWELFETRARASK